MGEACSKAVKEDAKRDGGDWRNEATTAIAEPARTHAEGVKAGADKGGRGRREGVARRGRVGGTRQTIFGKSRILKICATKAGLGASVAERNGRGRVGRVVWRGDLGEVGSSEQRLTASNTGDFARVRDEMDLRVRADDASTCGT